MPKRTREVVHTYTQAELISRALDTEEGNILEHRNYLDEEEEKRKRAKVVRKAVTGPVLRYISKIGEDKITIPVKPPPPPPPPKMLPMIPLLEHSTDTVPSASNANGYGVSTSTNTQTLVARDVSRCRDVVFVPCARNLGSRRIMYTRSNPPAE